MTHKSLRFRQVHLDFHTSGAIQGIGARFDKAQFQDCLRTGHVDSITCFSSCHHGWSYHPTDIGAMHPHLSYNLLRAQIDACKEIGVKAPIYLTAGVDNVAAEAHPEWREIGVDGCYQGWTGSPLRPGFKTMCFNTPYMDYLVAKIEEAVRMFPEADGVFLDIIHQGPCCCTYCMRRMAENGLDPENEEDRETNARAVLLAYFERSTEACKVENADMPVFHNSGHVAVGRREVLPYFSHLELESLPTGGWGYDHFPISAKYVAGLGVDFLGMTGKFHTTWGEFGGFKHPNALRYECAAMLANGSKCSIGDQLHPSGHMDESTYRLIGEAYREVEEKEPWCRGGTNVADIGVLSSAGNHVDDPDYRASRENAADTGCARVLLEGHYLFSILDEEMDFSPYRLLILPDDIDVGPALYPKLENYLAGGGKLLFTGRSGLGHDGASMFEFGADVEGASPYTPDFVLPAEDLRPEFVDSPMVMYMRSRRLTITNGKSLGEVYDPYFNRTYDHFCSHQHTPPRVEASGFSAGSILGSVAYVAHPVFGMYYAYGAVAYRRYVEGVIDLLLGDAKRLSTNLPSTARVTLMEHADENRQVLHLLYAPTIKRGSDMVHSGGSNQSGGARQPKPLEVVEDLPPLSDVEVTVQADGVKTVTLEPQGTEIPFQSTARGVSFRVESFACHQMVVLSR